MTCPEVVITIGGSFYALWLTPLPTQHHNKHLIIFIVQRFIDRDQATFCEINCLKDQHLDNLVFIVVWCGDETKASWGNGDDYDVRDHSNITTGGGTITGFWLSKNGCPPLSISQISTPSPPNIGKIWVPLTHNFEEKNLYMCYMVLNDLF